MKLLRDLILLTIAWIGWFFVIMYVFWGTYYLADSKSKFVENGSRISLAILVLLYFYLFARVVVRNVKK